MKQRVKNKLTKMQIAFHHIFPLQAEITVIETYLNEFRKWFFSPCTLHQLEISIKINKTKLITFLAALRVLISEKEIIIIIRASCLFLWVNLETEKGELIFPSWTISSFLEDLDDDITALIAHACTSWSKLPPRALPIHKGMTWLKPYQKLF